jgi:hypothetical protein
VQRLGPDEALHVSACGGEHQYVAEKAAGDQAEAAQQSAEQRSVDDAEGGDLIVIGVLSRVLASCARIPTPEEATDAVLTLRQYESWAWALGIALIWGDLVLPVLQTAVVPGPTRDNDLRMGPRAGVG